jgi:hypothetical protein
METRDEGERLIVAFKTSKRKEGFLVLMEESGTHHSRAGLSSAH